MNDPIRDKLKRVGLKTTESRKAILGIFYDRLEPISAEDIYSRTKREGLDMATVYRTLSSFEKARLINKVDLRKDAQYYERSDSDHHHHIVCKECGKIEDFEFCDVDCVTEKALKKSSFAVVDNHSLELFGICKKCVK